MHIAGLLGAHLTCDNMLFDNGGEASLLLPKDGLMISRSQGDAAIFIMRRTRGLRIAS